MFELFGVPHVAALASTALISAALILLVRRPSVRRRRRILSLGLAALVAGNELIWYVCQVSAGRWTAATSLPLQLCDGALIAAVVALASEWQVPFELAYYWGLGGTTQALVTPDLSAPFPRYEFFRYFFSHGGIVVAVLYLTLGVGLRPGRRSVLRTIGITAAFAACVGLADWLLGANYMFLCRRPEAPSLMDYFGKWPWSLIPLAACGFVTIAALYLPFLWLDRRRARKAAA